MVIYWDVRVCRNLRDKGVPSDYIDTNLDVILDKCCNKADEIRIDFSKPTCKKTKQKETNDRPNWSSAGEVVSEEEKYENSLNGKGHQLLKRNQRVNCYTKGERNLKSENSPITESDHSDLDWLLDDDLSREMLGINKDNRLDVLGCRQQQSHFKGSHDKMRPKNKTVNDCESDEEFDDCFDTLLDNTTADQVQGPIVQSSGVNHDYNSHSVDLKIKSLQPTESKQRTGLSSVNKLLQSLTSSTGKQFSASKILNSSRHYKTIQSSVSQIGDISNAGETSHVSNGTIKSTQEITLEKYEERDNRRKFKTHVLDDKFVDNDKCTETETAFYSGSDGGCCLKSKTCVHKDVIPDSVQESTEASFISLVLGLSHGSEDMMTSLIGILDLSSPQFGEANINCIHNICIEGPLSQTPITVPGIVVKARTEFLDIVTKYDQTSIKTVIVNGDITYNYKHIGYKKTLSTKQVLSDRVTGSEENIEWLNTIEDILKLYSIRCLIVKGSVCNEVIDLCLNRNVIVLDGVNYRTLQGLANQFDICMVTYLTDVTEANVCSLLVTQYCHDWMLKPCNHVILKADVMVNNLNTIVLSHPSKNGCDLLEQEFEQCINVLSSALSSGYVLPGYAKTEEITAQYLTEIGQEQSSDIYLSVVCEEVAAGFQEFVWTVQRNVQDIPSQEKIIVDDYKTKLSAWKTSLNTAMTIFHTDSYIINDHNQTL
ncbi:Bardet-Biedl syndrome 12 protein-like isoform X3 [Mytilus trossulus]|uniref:Bardet-Biedl syndrome 12 protein-like isoform X2 n=1 Tax=Mytilus trossulus TaxID=6551 RepID=UPI003004C8AF